MQPKQKAATTLAHLSAHRNANITDATHLHAPYQLFHLTVSIIGIQIYPSFVSVFWGMQVIALKREAELLRRNNKSLLRSPHPISSLKTPLRVYHSLKSVTHKNNYVWGWERNNLNKPRPPRYVWDSPWSIYTFYQIDHDCLIVFNLYCLRTFLRVLPYVMHCYSSCYFRLFTHALRL